MDQLEYVKKWIKRPIFLGLDKDKEILEMLVLEIEELRKAFDKPVAYSRINDRGDLYDLRLQSNPYSTDIIPLYLRPDYATYRQQAMQSHSKKP